MLKKILLIAIITLIGSCKSETKKSVPQINMVNTIEIKYAKGFEITKSDTSTIITIKNPWPGSDKTFQYLLTANKKRGLDPNSYNAVIETPIENVVVTSTTHIPSLEMLGVENKLIGFPNLDYISSQKTRNLIEQKQIKELGKNEDINMEVLIDLSPEAFITFAVESSNKMVESIEKTGIPVLYNSDWTEIHPLGKAEWIKFFGVLFNKEKEADSIFSKIEHNYLTVKNMASKANKKPTVLSGAMYKDVWYLPQGDSWAAQFIKDANGDYLWENNKGTGSISLNIESVLEKGKDADFWIGPGQFTSFLQMQEVHSAYTQFEAFKQKKVYTFTAKKGETGGVLYYELAPNRPDIVLKDIIKILHPEILPEHTLYFFNALN